MKFIPQNLIFCLQGQEIRKFVLREIYNCTKIYLHNIRTYDLILLARRKYCDLAGPNMLTIETIDFGEVLNGLCLLPWSFWILNECLNYNRKKKIDELTKLLVVIQLLFSCIKWWLLCKRTVNSPDSDSVSSLTSLFWIWFSNVPISWASSFLLL